MLSGCICRGVEGKDLWTFRKHVKGADECGKAIGTAGLGIKIHEFPIFAGVFAGRLEMEMFDKHWSEALLVLDLHAVENAAVRVDADEERFGRFEVLETLGGVTHSMSSIVNPHALYVPEAVVPPWPV